MKKSQEKSQLKSQLLECELFGTEFLSRQHIPSKKSNKVTKTKIKVNRDYRYLCSSEFENSKNIDFSRPILSLNQSKNEDQLSLEEFDSTKI